jgi:hypothetical protein
MGTQAQVAYLDGFARLFDSHLDESIRLARSMGAEDPERVAEQAFARLQPRMEAFATTSEALAYLRAVVCLLSRGDNRRVCAGRRLGRRPASPEVIGRLRSTADEVEVVAASLGAPSRRQEQQGRSRRRARLQTGVFAGFLALALTASAVLPGLHG